MNIFHHGVSTKRTEGGAIAVREADSAIIGIVGSAPYGAVNELTLCQTSKDFAKFGTCVGSGFSIIDALSILARYQAGKIYVVNVLDPKKHKTTVTDEVLTIQPNSLNANTAKKGLITISIKSNAQALTQGTDYTVNLDTGEIVFKAFKENLKATYDYADASKVTNEEFLGGIDSVTQKRTGLEALKDGFYQFGSDAKILIAPAFDKDARNAAALQIKAEQLKAVAYIDIADNATLSQAITARGSNGKLNANTSSQRVRHFYPKVIGLNGTESLATHAAGLRMKIDTEKGYWHSTSNKELLGVVDSTVKLTARLDDPQSETNLLNAVGITTVFNSFGTGFRLWGNRSANFPSNTHIINFETALRTADIIDEAIKKAELNFIDRPIDSPLIDALLETIDTYLRALPSIVGYSVDLDRTYDLVDSFSKGQIPIVYEFTPKLPAELIVNASVVTRKYLVNLIGE